MANKNFKARVGIEAPLIAADDGTTAITLSGANVTVVGDLTVSGTTTTIDTQNLLVEDKNIIIGNVTSPTDTTADGGGITLKGSTDKTITWVDSTDNWTFNQSITTSGNLDVQGGTITDSTGALTISTGAGNGNITLTPNGTGDVILSADTVQVGDNASPATITTQGQATLTINAGDASGSNVAGSNTTIRAGNGTGTGGSGSVIFQTAPTGSSGSTANTMANVLTLASGANGAITLDPNGTGNVVVTLVDGGNLTNSRNYVFGTLRNSTLTSQGDIWAINPSSSSTFTATGSSISGTTLTIGTLTSGTIAVGQSLSGGTTTSGTVITANISGSGSGSTWTVSPSQTVSSTTITGTASLFRGINLDNSADTTRGPGTVIRSFTGALAANNGSRGRVVFERARNTSASPASVQSGDAIGSIDATGYTSTGWINDNIVPAVTATMQYTASENWVSNTNLGTTWGLIQAPTSTTIVGPANLIQTLTINPQTFASRSDAFTWANGKTGTTQTMALDVSGNLTVTSNVRVNGNNIQNSGGTSAITLTSANATTTVRGDTFKVNKADDTNLLQLSTISGRVTLTLAQSRATAASTFATMQFNTYRSADGTNYTPSQSGDDIGQFKFNGNAFTGTNPGPALGPGAALTCYATENWSGFTSTGSSISGTTLTIGTLTNGAVAVGQEIFGTGVTTGTRITANISGSGSGSTWTITPSQTVASTTISGGVNGTKFTMNTIKTGTLTDFALFDGSSDLIELKSTQTRILDVNGNIVVSVNATNTAFSQPVKFPAYTRTAAAAITGAVGWQIAISDSSGSGGGRPNGLMAYWDTTNSRWSYIHDNSAV